MSRSRSKFFVITTFDVKCPNQHTSPTQFCASSDHFRDKQKSIVDLKQVDQVHEMQFWQL